jgi:putative phage-type endonuclease
MIHTHIEQGTPEWLALRAGCVTASSVSAVKAKSKDGKGEGITRRKYRIQIITEWLTGKPVGSTFTSSAIEHGKEMEPIARAAYEAETGNFVDQVTFVTRDDIEHFGCSPDGLINEDGLIEIKCPESHTHFGYLSAGVVPTDYKDQMLCQCLVTGRKWVDFVSFDNRMPPHLQLFIVRYEPTAEELAALEGEVIKFLTEAKAEYLKWSKA